MRALKNYNNIQQYMHFIFELRSFIYKCIIKTDFNIA